MVYSVLADRSRHGMTVEELYDYEDQKYGSLRNAENVTLSSLAQGELVRGDWSSSEIRFRIRSS